MAVSRDDPDDEDQDGRDDEDRHSGPPDPGSLNSSIIEPGMEEHYFSALHSR